MSLVLVHDGISVREITLDAWCALATPPAFTWFHIDGRHEDARALAGRLANMPDAALRALVAQETRPRCTFMSAGGIAGALVNLRGLCGGAEPDGDPLVSIRLWAQKGLIVSAIYRDLAALPRMIEQMKSGTISDPGDFIACLAQEITDELDPDVAELGDDLDDIESGLSEEGLAESRRRVAHIRATAIAYRRFLSPQRQAVERLAMADARWLEEDDKLHLQDAADRCARMAEELEAVRERSALTHEALTDLRAEQMNQQALVLAVVALVFLPLTFITGLLGMNVDGIPFAHEHWAFWGVTGFCVATALAIAGWFAATNWLKQ
ncbi:CorA family divalent cation transporter [Sphingobium sp. H39-3-25]|uniref:CorA family divalent cation transporter n=1 Tax=Sphingobium arseniciresistens TaxID=3030834 RepID=UPI0023B9DEF0|nr:CorA family divalent cation transporter [Sphingobium arseniciresistens]